MSSVLKRVEDGLLRALIALVAALWLFASALLLLLRALAQGFHRQFDAAFFIRAHDLDYDDLAFGQHIRHFFDAVMADLADVQQTIFSWQQTDEGAEVEQFRHRTFVDFADFDFSRQRFDAAFRVFCLG